MTLHADTCGPAHLEIFTPPLVPWHSLRSFLFNVRTLGFCWWLRCALWNAFAALRRRPPDP